jgi:hypothetical protein
MFVFRTASSMLRTYCMYEHNKVEAHASRFKGIMAIFALVSSARSTFKRQSSHTELAKPVTYVRRPVWVKGVKLKVESYYRRYSVRPLIFLFKNRIVSPHFDKFCACFNVFPKALLNECLAGTTLVIQDRKAWRGVNQPLISLRAATY